MSVINGQKADAATFNSAFGSKQDDNTFFGIQTLDHTGSGAIVADAQQAINDVIASDALKIPLSQKGQPLGVAELGADGKVPSAQLPSYVDDVIEVATFSALPPTGETGKIYVTLDTNYSYRWSGSTYVFIGRPITTTDDLIEGSTNLYFTDGRAQTATISQVITDGVTDKAPSEDVVFDALALKLDSADFGTEFDTAFGLKDTDDLTEGLTNLYFTDLRAQTATITATISNGVTDKAPSSDAVFDALALKQDGIQFKDEGSNLGTSGTVTSVDFVGSGVTATRIGNAVSVSISTAGPTPITCRAYKNSGSHGSSGSDIVVTSWASKEIDTNTAFNLVTGEFTVPATRKYYISGTVAFGVNATGSRVSYVAVNGTKKIISNVYATFADSAIMVLTGVLQLSAGDIVTFRAFQNCGGGLGYDATVVDVPGRTQFNIIEIGS